MELIAKSNAGIEAGINDDGDLFLGDDRSGYNLPLTKKNVDRVISDFNRYLDKDETKLTADAFKEYIQDDDEDEEVEESINIRESLLNIDKDTDNEYDLCTLYESLQLDDNEKRDVVKMLTSKTSPSDIYECLNNKLVNETWSYKGDGAVKYAKNKNADTLTISSNKKINEGDVRRPVHKDDKFHELDDSRIDDWVSTKDIIKEEFGKPFPDLSDVSYYNYYDKDRTIKGVSIDRVPSKFIAHHSYDFNQGDPTQYIYPEEYSEFVDFVKHESKPVSENAQFAVDMLEDAFEEYTNAKITKVEPRGGQLIITFQDDDGTEYSFDLFKELKSGSTYFIYKKILDWHLAEIIKTCKVSGVMTNFIDKYNLEKWLKEDSHNMKTVNEAKRRAHVFDDLVDEITTRLANKGMRSDTDKYLGIYDETTSSDDADGKFRMEIGELKFDYDKKTGDHVIIVQPEEGSPRDLSFARSIAREYAQEGVRVEEKKHNGKDAIFFYIPEDAEPFDHPAPEFKGRGEYLKKVTPWIENKEYVELEKQYNDKLIDIFKEEGWEDPQRVVDGDKVSITFKDDDGYVYDYTTDYKSELIDLYKKQNKIDDFARYMYEVAFEQADMKEPEEVMKESLNQYQLTDKVTEYVDDDDVIAYEKIARVLRTNLDNLYVVEDDSYDYDPQFLDRSGRRVAGIEAFKYEVNGIPVVRERASGGLRMYFRNSDDAEKYVEYVKEENGLDEGVVSSNWRSDDDPEDETTYNYDDELAMDLDDDAVQAGETFIEDGREWQWIKQIGDVEHIDFDNWAVWFATDVDTQDGGYFIVDIDTGFIDWGPVDTEEEAKEFLQSKVDDEDEPYEDDYVDESVKTLKEEKLNLDSTGKRLKKLISQSVLDSDEELRDYVNKIVDEVIEERNDDTKDESLTDSVDTDSSELNEDIDLSSYEEVDGGPGYWTLYRKFKPGMKKAEWVVKNQNTGEIRKISYKQATGEEPIEDSPVKSLARDVGKKLLPSKLEAIEVRKEDAKQLLAAIKTDSKKLLSELEKFVEILQQKGVHTTNIEEGILYELRSFVEGDPEKVSMNDLLDYVVKGMKFDK